LPKVVVENSDRSGLAPAVAGIFKEFGGGRAFLKKSGEIFLKVNAIDFRAYCFTDPVFLGAVIDYFYQEGAKRVYVMENATQGNFTRMVFARNGYLEIIKKHKARALYLDEGPAASISLPHLGYPIDTARVIVEKLIEQKDQHTYVSLPKLKTHSMTGVTLGVKNQFGLIHQYDRIDDHNFRLHQKLADILCVIKPDFTLIEGLEATDHGHYPLTSCPERFVVPLQVLIGGDDVVAVDTVAVKVMGMDPGKIEHLRWAREWGLGEGDLNKIEIKGDLKRFTHKFTDELIPDFPPDVNVIKGKERVCKEGCQNNLLMLVQMLAFDQGGKGGFSLVIGKGFEKEDLKKTRHRVLVVGKCAVEEAAPVLKREGRRIFQVSGHNNLSGMLQALLILMRVNPLKITGSPGQSLFLVGQALAHGSKATVLRPDRRRRWQHR